MNDSKQRFAAALLKTILEGGQPTGADLDKMIAKLREKVDAAIEESFVGPARRHVAGQRDPDPWIFGPRVSAAIKAAASRADIADGTISALIQMVLDREEALSGRVDQVRSLETTILRMDIDLTDTQGRLADAEERCAGLAAENAELRATAEVARS